MVGVERKERQRKCLNGDKSVMKQKKRRRKEGSFTCAAPRQTSTEPRQVDSSALFRGSAGPGLAKKKKRLRSSQSECHSNDLGGEVASEEEKQSLLAWVEKGIKPTVDATTMKDSLPWVEECIVRKDDGNIIKVGHSLKSPAVSYSNRYALTYSNGEPNQTEICISAAIAHNFSNGTKTCSSNGRSSYSCDSLKESSEVSELHWQSHILKGSDNNNMSKAGSCQSGLRSLPYKNKRKREVDKVLDYVVKRCVVVKTLSGDVRGKPRTTITAVTAWERSIPVTLTSEASVVEEWISSHNGDLFGLDVEWRPNRLKGQRNKVALLQLSNGEECLIVQMLFLDRQPQALRKLLSDPSKGLAGVGVLADGKRLLQDYGLDFQGGIELTTLAVERLKREELKNVGLKVLVQEVLGLALEKPKRVTLSNWAKEKLDQVQINYACMDAWASFALSKRLLVQT
ncbi:hypothetical protein L7F22_059227 [Adiantum nelumboides]|nr:hypothetical protein [Adiantum nelumboides]